MHTIRPERSSDAPGIRHVNLSAFETDLEANIVDTLRVQADPLVSLVAVIDDIIVGHILFSPVMLLSQPDLPMMGLAPMVCTAAPAAGDWLGPRARGI